MASVVDPFGNILGIMNNPHYLDILDSTKRRDACQTISTAGRIMKFQLSHNTVLEPLLRLSLILKKILLSIAIVYTFVSRRFSKIVLSIFQEREFFPESCTITKVCTSFLYVCLRDVGPPTVNQVSRTLV